MSWEVVIGLETHAQLRTQSKIFSGASTAFGAPANSQACIVDLALPGALPVVNKEAIACAIRFGLAVDAHIAPRSVFARKNYFYPDLPKGYQISQMDEPVVEGGTVSFIVPDGKQGVAKTVNLTRAHLEEDAGKSLHEAFQGRSGIDLNRAGTPLLEIVTEPEMSSSAEAVAYARSLHALVVWLDICDGNMQEGSFRCDANVSIRRPGEPLGTRSEIKNINSFRFLEKAIDFEISRQIELLEDGGKVVQETRLYDADRDETRSMRSKEDAHDYRYFPDPDLPDLIIDPSWIESVKGAMPELPAKARERFQADYGLSDYDVNALTSSRDIADYFEQAAGFLSAPKKQAKLIANWVLSELSAAVKRDDQTFAHAGVRPVTLAALVTRIDDGTISGNAGKDLFGHAWAKSAQSVEAPSLTDALSELDAQIDSLGLRQMNDDGALGAIVDDVLAKNQKSVDEFLSGKDKALNALVGQVMKATKGKGNPRRINEMLRESVSKRR